jgi:hypothetical protein
MFLVADKGMQKLLQGLFQRERFELCLGCGWFEIDPRLNKDVFIPANHTDGGLAKHAPDLLSPYEPLYRRAIVMVDKTWSGSPGAERIRAGICEKLVRADRWEQFEVIVLDPLLEAWLWQENNPNVAAALKYRGTAHYRQVLRDAGLWPSGEAKPPAPKEAWLYLRKKRLADPSDAVFERLAGTVSTQGCQDAAFRLLCDTLAAWFPPEIQEHRR